ncbi:hypothetical protein HOLleu_27662 [Holothuria leucospilota]|uniref:Uncharacterized protein n=1 Tax=Holothuria leucospilota TaxID=206669 RepID=A0A9Q1BQZ1_HOLLE|nr:hypothetical protein HOLleu_27662 [Holothuria leucospilota]
MFYFQFDLSLFAKLGRSDDRLSRACRIVLVELCDEDPLGFQIFANVTNHPENTDQSIFANVGLELAGTTYEMRLHDDLRVNGVPAMKPYEEDSNGVFAAEVSPDMHIIRVSDDVNDLIRIAYNYKLHRIDVHLKSSLFSNLICGACANKPKVKRDLDSVKVWSTLYNCDFFPLKR